MLVGRTVELQCITLGEGNGTAYSLQREQCRVMEADQAMMDILGKVMPYKVGLPSQEMIHADRVMS